MNQKQADSTVYDDDDDDGGDGDADDDNVIVFGCSWLQKMYGFCGIRYKCR